MLFIVTCLVEQLPHKYALFKFLCKILDEKLCVLTDGNKQRGACGKEEWLKISLIVMNDFEMKNI